VIRFFPKTFCLLGEAIRKRQDVLEATSLHSALLSIQGRRERVMAFSSQIKARYRAVTSVNAFLIGRFHQ
jgi:hypothetical protein